MGYKFTVQGKETVSVENDFSKMSKLELEEFGRTIGIELDRRLSKPNLIKQLEEAVSG
jgi:hypothetical protein|tara:strand:+ start:415 stop:588 length:174 start_codon:yes stop_codon:yes gene_type:complete